MHVSTVLALCFDRSRLMFRLFDCALLMFRLSSTYVSTVFDLFFDFTKPVIRLSRPEFGVSTVAELCLDNFQPMF